MIKKLLIEREFLLVLALFTLLRLVAVRFMGLMPQDAYYTYYSDDLALSYFDHPPMIAYMIKLFTFILGKSVLTLHIADFIMTSFTLLFVYLLIRPSLKVETVKRTVILLITAPFITILSINSTPDVPLLFFWSLTLLLAFNAVKSGKLYLWIAAGIVAGLAFDSKYTAIFLPLGLSLFLLISKEHRSKLFSREFLMFVLAFFIAILPVVIWNIDNEFISFRYQAAERATQMSSFSFNPLHFPGYFASQLLIALPLLLISIFASGYLLVKRLIRGEEIEDYLLFAASFAIPMLLVFTGISFIYWVKINWIMPVYLSGVVLAALYLKSNSLIRWQTGFSVVFHIALIVQLIWMPAKVNSDDTWWGWEKLAQKVESLNTKNPHDFIFSDNSYKVSAVLNFYMADHIYAGNVIERSAFQFALDDDNLSHLWGRDAIYVTTDRFRRKRIKEGTVEQILNPYFSGVHIMDSLILMDSDGDEHRRFYFYHCHNYMPLEQLKKPGINPG
ncbi:MAG: glycosyltransferase family 39 protein [Bacteroidales bacterium]|nr:glycosyltransferase family 39 protein [Bacteroidales bacterium]